MVCLSTVLAPLLPNLLILSTDGNKVYFVRRVSKRLIRSYGRDYVLYHFSIHWIFYSKRNNWTFSQNMKKNWLFLLKKEKRKILFVRVWGLAFVSNNWFSKWGTIFPRNDFSRKSPRVSGPLYSCYDDTTVIAFSPSFHSYISGVLVIVRYKNKNIRGVIYSSGASFSSIRLYCYFLQTLLCLDNYFVWRDLDYCSSSLLPLLGSLGDEKWGGIPQRNGFG